MVVGLTAAAPAPDTATLKWKFDPKSPFYQEMTSETTQNMKVAGSDIKNEQKQTFYFSWTPVEQDKDGNWILKQKIEGVKMSIKISGSPDIVYDSTKEGASSTPLGEFFKVLDGSEFKITINKDMKVAKVEGREDFIKKLGGANPQMEPLLNKILSEDALKEMADPTFAAIPPTEVTKDKPWQRPSKFDMGPIGKYSNTYKYTYQGKDSANAKLDRVKVDITVKYEKPDETAAGAGLPFKIKSAELTPKNSTGFILFDNEKGRVESAESTLDMDGTLDIEIGGQVTKVELKQVQKASAKTSDTNPIAKK